jgi:hypothetical protein
MAQDDWISKDFDELNRDLNGLFTERYIPFKFIAGSGGFLTVGKTMKRWSTDDTGRMEE